MQLDYSLYDNPLITRYASASMAALFGPQRKHSTWRRLWLALAEAQQELGLLTDDGLTPRIKPEQIEELRNHLDDIDFAKAAFYEKKFRHDVMAHIHTLGDAAPSSRSIIHLGATSCFVTDNTDLILMREGLESICSQLVMVIDDLARFAETWRGTPALGYTHFQPAQLTTVGKRATLWCYDLVLDLYELEHRRAQLKLRGVKGTTGTQASFLELFQGDHQKVQALEKLVAQKMGFKEVYPVTGQTYSRKVDSQILDALSGLGQSLQKWGTDLRLLAHEQEIDEPFEKSQIGSSAMAYKRNPMRAERMCSLGRFLNCLPAMASQTASSQWLERTLDDSAIRRLSIPQSFLAADGSLRIARNLALGLVVQESVIAKNVAEALPYMATENLMIAAVAQGADRQEAHERIRLLSHQVTELVKAGNAETSFLIQLLKVDPLFSGIDYAAEMAPEKYIGRSSQQVEEFIAEVIEPIRNRYQECLRTTSGESELQV